MKKSLILISQGDINGIGLEILFKAFQKYPEKFKNTVLISNKKSVLEYAEKIGKSIRFSFFNSINEISLEKNTVKVLDILNYCPVNFGSCDKLSGKISFLAVKYALDIIKNNNNFKFSLLTLPISKEAWFKAGITYPGHTDFLAEYMDVKNYTMILYSKRFSVALVTIHIPLSQVPQNITEDKVKKTVENALSIGKKLYDEKFKLAVSALNPHAGENGYLGCEEDIIKKAIQNLDLKDKNIYPPDTLFYKVAKGDFNMVVCMYHDQGLIPFKALNFDEGVNITVGLPFIRTSPDHGVAFDIAGKNLAKEDSFLQALEISRVFL